jgi:3-dehydroquinate synthase
MVSIPVEVAARCYEVKIEDGLLAKAGDLLRAQLPEHRSVFIVTVDPVLRKWGRPLTTSLRKSGFLPHFLRLPEGERYKRLSTVEELADKLAKLGADRDALILAFGGGVAGDVGGFLASVYMRGLDFVQIPTTVLAQVDASIGGKTGVNLKAGKNLVGAFHQPRAVLIDPAVLSTLSAREYRAGLYESLKAGIIGDVQLFEEFENNRAAIAAREPKTVERIIAASVRLKARVVSADEREYGLRRILNLGHTIGHALEAETGYRKLLHGEAVAWGMIAAARIAEFVGRLGSPESARMVAAVRALGPLPKLEITSRSIVRRLLSDKKTRGGKVHFILPGRIGEVEVVNNVPEPAVLEAVKEIRSLSHLK